MQFVPVESTSIRAVAYDESRLLMRVEFRDGEVYDYTAVPPRTFSQLLRAASIGQYFNAHVRNGPYNCRRANDADSQS